MPRPVEWFTVETDFLSLATGAQTNKLLYNAASSSSAAVKGATVTRMIVDVRLRATSLAQLNKAFWGIVVINADARAANAFPDPAEMADRPGWLARGRLQTIQDSLSDASQWDKVQLDLRSQRILRAEGDELHLIFENGATGFTAEMSAFVRTLMRLPG